ncbi:MAG: non-ribosomal peptide synthetase [Synergistaceae bacterium]|nr:non-ribosomal peptide synthetase [Synergistaceae bacterium]
MEEFSLIKKFAENCTAYPNHTAIIDVATDTSMTYHELDDASGKVYRYLTERGIGKEDVVMILLPRSAKPFVAVVGVWKAGAAYVMLEADYPKEKIEFIKHDANCKLVIDETVFEEMMKGEPLDGYRVADSHDLSRLIYTSGTTGNPKGVMHEYGIQRMDVAAWSCEGKPFVQYGDVVAHISPLNFVATIMVFHTAMDACAAIAVFPFEISRNISSLLLAIEKYNVTVGFFSPSLLRLIQKFPPCVKTVVTGSEPTKDVYYENMDTYNCYGQTESGSLLLTFKINKKYDITPAGKPVLSENDVCILDDDGKQVQNGEVGEICYKQPYLRGYLNLPDRNADIFRNGYVRSGDMAKILPDGKFLILGRTDDMVKINGNRVEPAEIEVAVKKVLGTEWVGVRVFTGEEKSFVCAYYIGEPVLPIEEAKKIIRERLVSYMVPAFYTKIDKIPVNANGKFQRNDLPAPDFKSYVKEYVAPSNEMEEKLCNAMASVLGVERVGATDDFYEIGGSSINAIKVITQLNLNQLDVNMLLKGRTPREIVKLLENEDLNNQLDLKEQNEKLLLSDQPISVTQQYILDVQQEMPDSTMWNLPILLRFGDDTDFERLKMAVDTVLAAHPVFSCVYAKEANEILVHKYDANKKFDTKIENITEAEFEALKETLVQPFELFGKPLYRIRLFKTESGGYLFGDFHHSIVDGTSIKIFLGDLNKVYEGVPLECDYYFVALDERRKKKNSTLYSKAKAYYERVYDKYEWSICLRPDNEIDENKYGTTSAAIPIESYVYEEIYKQYGLGKNAFFIIVACLAIFVTDNENNVMLSWIYNGRNTIAEQHVTGAMLRAFYVGIRFNNERTMGEIYHDVMEQLKNNIYYSCYSYFGPQNVRVGGEASLNFLQDLKSLAPDGKLSWMPVDMTQSKEVADDLLDIEILDGRDGCSLVLEYNACAYKEETIDNFKKLFVKIAVVLAENINNPDMRITELLELIR